MTAEALRPLAARNAVVLLSAGQHGPHLPAGVDDTLVTEVCLRMARRLGAGGPWNGEAA